MEANRMKNCKYCLKVMIRKNTIYFCKCGVTYLSIANAWHNPNENQEKEFLK